MDIFQLIDASDLDNHSKSALKVLYRQNKRFLEQLPLETQLHELIHFYRGDHFVRRNCTHCYIHNLIADFQVEKFIHEHWPLDRSEKISRLKEQLQCLGLTGEMRDLLHWNCDKCPFKQMENGDRPQYTISMKQRCIKLQYLLERLIKQMLPKTYVGITHRNYISIQKRTKTVLPTKRIRKQDLNVIIDTSTSIPLSIVQTAIETTLPFIQDPHVHLYGFSDICYEITDTCNIRYKDVTRFKPVYEKTKHCRYNIVITDLQFDDFVIPLPKNYKVISVGTNSNTFSYNPMQVI